jgi:transmembrane sensor
MNFFQQIFRRYQQKKSNEQEQELVDRWYDATGKARPPVWMDSQHIQETREKTWKEMTMNLGLEKSPESIAPAPVVVRLRSLTRYVAAAMVIGLGAWGISNWLSPVHQKQKPVLTAMETYSTEQGMRKHVQLSDGTEVWLNNGSTLRVRKAADGDSIREVWLAEGEAYFKVAKDPQKPFIVHMDSLQTRVLGTAFSIRAYRELPQLQIAVTEGSVQVGHSGKVLDTLTRNMQLIYQSANGRYTTTQKEMPLQDGWWNNRFVLDKAAFDELVLRMKLRYSVIIKSSNNRILQTAFTANFPQDASLGNVLETLCALYSTHYSIKKDNIIIY